MPSERPTASTYSARRARGDAGGHAADVPSNVRQIGQPTLLDTQNGSQAHIQVTALGRGRSRPPAARIDTNRYGYSGDVSEDEWFDDHRRSVRTTFEAPKDRRSSNFAGMNPADRFARLPDLLAADADLATPRTLVTVDRRIDVGDSALLLGLENSALAASSAARGRCAPRASRSRAATRPGRSIGRPMPAPGWHDLFALAQRGVASGRRLPAAAPAPAIIQGPAGPPARSPIIANSTTNSGRTLNRVTRRVTVGQVLKPTLGLDEALHGRRRSAAD